MLGHYPGAAELLCHEVYSRLLLEDGEVPGGYHGLYAWGGLRFPGVNREDTSVGVGTRQHLAMKHSGQVYVGSKLGSACHLLQAVQSRRPGA